MLRDLITRAKPMVEAQAQKEQARYDAWHPFARSCLFCKKRHRRPRPVRVIEKSGKQRIRWASNACLKRKFGDIKGAYVFQVYR